MVDDIEIPKIFSPISQTARVTRVKQRDADVSEGYFARHLHDEGEKEKEEEHSEEASDSSVRGEGTEENSEGPSGASGREERDLAESGENKATAQGKLIDILI